MTYTRTADLDLVRSILTHPRIYPWAGDDSAPAAEGFQPNPDDRIWYVLVHDGVELLGLLVFLPHVSVCWEVHCALLPCAWGPRTAEALSGAFGWIWARTECRRVVAAVPAGNKLACRLAFRAGMDVEGVRPGSWLKRGRLEDLILFGIGKG
jgi:RimJ/RimL family protein N-acetyltransferase